MKYLLSLVSLLLMSVASCSRPEKEARPIHNEVNSVYYWKTVFHLDSADMRFIDRHNVRRIYLRMFDVAPEPGRNSLDEKAQPNATVRIHDEDYYRFERDSLGHREFVPVVYITLDALKAMNGHEEHLAENIVTRVKNMCSYNSIPNVIELQLDCDWTVSTEASYFSLCKSVKKNIAALKLPWRLSSTVRLHQLARKAPPVDNGVLMVYNTGNFNDPDAANSIIDVNDVTPYLKHLSGYPLHLDVAYPTYSWQLLFRRRQFIGLLNGLDLADTSRFSRRSDNVYVAIQHIPYNNKVIMPGDMVRQETSSFKDISAVKNLIEKRLSGRPHSNIIYHLDSNNLSNYTTDEIENILSAAL